MSEEKNSPIIAPEFSRFSAVLFLAVGCMTLLITFWNWYYDIKPRLVNEAKANILNLSSAQARSIESEFQNVLKGEDISILYNTLNEMLLLNNPASNDPLFFGIVLEIDYDAIPMRYDIHNIQVGNANCRFCLVSEVPMYDRARSELAGIIKIYANPIFNQRLLGDIATNLALIVFGIVIMLLIAWITTGKLLRRLKDRESRLLFEISERKAAEKQLHQIAVYDQLTNLPNRYLLHSEFKSKLEESIRNNKVLATLFFDLDHFKKINDLHGHETGDILLKEVAHRISHVTRGYDLLARFGGDEFVMIMSNITDRSDVIQVAEKIISGFEHSFKLSSISVNVTTSVGISIFPDDGNDPSTLLKNADMAMYRAKVEGRNCYQFFNERMNQELHRAQWIETNLEEALTNDGLELYFQPQISLTSGEVESCEALLRWPQLNGEDIEPEEFIAVAERTGQINVISEWVMNSACKFLRHWRDSSFKSIRIDINLSAKDISDQGLLTRIIDTLKFYDLEPHQLGIEITENILLDSTDRIIEILSELRAAGVFIAIDDFGTGYSSLNYLKQFPVSGLKIDRTFIDEAPDNGKDQIIMQAIVNVGHGLGLSVNVEGVETKKHFALCQKVKCDSLQGNYISEALPAESFVEKYLQKA